MAYTEIKEKNSNRYYYRVRTIRLGKKFRKHRVYMGKNLREDELAKKESQADNNLQSTSKKIKNRELERLIPKIKRVLIKYKVKKAGIFGSYARGEQKKSSDIDILIEPPKGIGWGIVTIQIELEDKLNRKVDLLTYNGINHLLRKRILEEEKRVL